MRLLGAGWIVAFLMWLPVEDTQIWLAVALAAAACLWVAARVRVSVWWQAALLGAGIGAGIPLLALSLMAFKGGLHGHGFADFSARQVWSLVSWLPLSVVTLLGGGALVFGLSRLSANLRVK